MFSAKNTSFKPTPKIRNTVCEHNWANCNMFFRSVIFFLGGGGCRPFLFSTCFVAKDTDERDNKNKQKGTRQQYPNKQTI